MELNRAEHHLYRLEYHLVWTPKYRCKAFKKPYTDTLKQILIKIAYDYDMAVLEIEIPIDHVHMLVSIPPHTSISDAIRTFKSISAKEIFKRHPEFEQEYFWGGKLWSPSYYAETIGRVNELAIKKYIRDQLKKEERLKKRIKQLKLF
ncbi:IS200/IS605 family transposase [Candidatus Peregrinibacteria bacterium]|nr:IS200/IS605 family transposase [Candidatus Peregrinibacteria bacterium]